MATENVRMLMRSVLMIGVAAVLASQIPALLGLGEPPEVDSIAPEAESAATGAAPGVALIRADTRGHFNASFRINGKPVDGMIDTGASLVAINESTARRLGFAGSGLDFRHPVNTANGRTEAAHITLERMEIGSVRVRNVDAFVLRDEALSSVLVGVSFLKKLRSFSVEGGTLRLAQ